MPKYYNLLGLFERDRAMRLIFVEGHKSKSVLAVLKFLSCLVKN
jgi:hypothetical protein